MNVQKSNKIKNPPATTPGDFGLRTQIKLTVMLAALLTATALLTALTSGLLLLLTGLLLATLLTASLATLLLLAALLHITHFVVRHGEVSFAPVLVPQRTKRAGQQCRNNDVNLS